MAISTYPLKLSAGQSLSAPLSIPANSRIVRIGIPVDWTSAPISFQMSLDGNIFSDLFHVAQTPAGGWVTYEASITSAPPGSIVLLPPDVGINVEWIKLRSGTRQAPVAQDGDRTFAIVFS
jgi:hypothetical protein